jgi:hypothetical protein
MRAKELVDQVPATYGQISHWIENGVKIGGKSKGEGHPREYSEIDVTVCKVLSGLAPLLGSGKRVPSAKDVMKKVATQVRREPSIAERPLIFITSTGRITEEPLEGYVVATGK